MKRIIVNALDPDAVRTAVRYVEEEEKHNQKRIDKLMKRIAFEAAKAAASTYNSGKTTVKAVPVKDGYSIEATGERVCFLEFGTGVYAQASANPLADESKLGFRVEPGSWSMSEGKGTWQDVIDGKITAEEYKYNRLPRPGMYNAYKAVIEHLKDWIAEEMR